MIKAEVVFDGDLINYGEYALCFSFECVDVYKNGELCKRLASLEQAIAYCLEQSHDPKTTD